MEKHSSLFFKGVGDEETTLQLGGSLAFHKLNMSNEVAFILANFEIDS
jgi:hypothetical protein